MIQNGTATLTDLNAAGAIQRGVTGDDYNSVSCPDNPVSGAGCLNHYAASIPNILPSRSMTWYQAIVFARNSGKRLPTNTEWQMAAFGTFDPGLNAQAPYCITATSNAGPQTGDFYLCISDVGVYNMIGNVAEFVADWSGDSVRIRGGSYWDSMGAGVLKHEIVTPDSLNVRWGFRGIR